MAKKKTFSYDKSVAEVEEILKKLQSLEYSSVDELVGHVDKAMTIIERCKEELGVIQNRIEKILNNE